MPNVLILGGTGYIGLALGQSLLRSGKYAVWGLARSSEKAKLLVANEITPVVGDAADPSIVAAAIASASIDIVVDASSAYENASAILEVVVSASKARLENLAKENALGPKLGFIYTSGLFVHGSPGGRVSDLSPVGNTMAKGSPATIVSWRPVHEQAILAARNYLEVAIIRPSLTYGRSSWAFDAWWSPFLDAIRSGTCDAIRIPAEREARAGIVHIDDVIAGFHAVVDHIDGRLGSWPVFDLVGETVLITEMMETTRKVLGIEAPNEYLGSNGNPFLEALNLVTHSDGARAKTVLGWDAKRHEFFLNLPIYFKAWEEAQKTAN